MSSEPAAFDRELDLGALFAGAARTRLASALEGLLGAEFRLCDESGAVLLAGAAGGSAARVVPLRHQLDVVGSLAAAEAAPGQLEAAAALLELLIASAAQLRMAADLHLQAVHEDYQVLLEKHAALTQSEARYKTLAAELEDRVRAQVATIERSQRLLYQAEKMASVGQLAAGVAHEINNPIGFIRSNLGTAQSYLQRFAELQAHARLADAGVPAAVWKENDLDFVLEDFAALLRESADGAERVAKIVADLKAFSNIDAAEETLLDLNDSLRAVANVAQPLLGGHAELILNLAPLPKLSCHPGRLNQAFLSLVQNAAQAVGQDGEIRIDSAVAAGEVRIAVRDNGIGIPDAAMSRIFDPFFTTREVGKGTGLGLTVARDIVVAHGGRIDVESQPGRGTTMTVSLPLDNRNRNGGVV